MIREAGVRKFSRARAAGAWLFSSRHSAAAIAQTAFTKFFLAAVNLGTGILTARSLGVAARGEQSAMLLWPALMAYLLTLGVPSALRYAIRRDPARGPELYTIGLLVAGVMSAVAYAVGVAFIPIWLRTYSPDVIHGAQILMIFTPEVAFGLILIAMLETIGDFKRANTVRYMPMLVTLAALVAMALSHTMTPFLSALAYLAPPVGTAMWMAWTLRSNFVPKLFDPRPGLRVLGSYGARAYGIDILLTLSAQIDQVLVIGILSATSMGVYVVALSASRVLQNLHSAVVTVIFPSASGLERERVVLMVARAARVSTLIGALFAAVLVSIYPFIIPLFYGGAFASAIPVTQILTVEALVGGLVSVLSQAFMALDRPGAVTLVQGLSLAVALPIMLLLMPHLGLIGAAIALLVSSLVRLAAVYALFPKILKVPVPNLVPTLEDLSIFRRAFAAR